MKYLIITIIAATTIAKLQGAPDEAEALAVLASEAGDYEKAMACNDLAVVGSAGAVAVLAELLADEKLHSYARNALEAIGDASAGEALLAALDRLEGRLLTGVILGLGDRGEVAAVPALRELAAGPAGEVADAALSSLGLIATDEAGETIVAVLMEGPDELREAAAHAALAAAARMAEEGRSAAALLDAVGQAEVAEHIKQAAAAAR